MTEVELDRIDQRILALVQENNLTPHREIADRVGLSAPAVTRRLQRLRKTRIIEGDVSLLNAQALGRSLTIIVQVVAHSERIDDLDKMRKAFLECPQIQHCYYVTGEADFILIFSVRDMEEYETLTRAQFFESGNVKKFTTFVSMQNVKVKTQIVI